MKMLTGYLEPTGEPSKSTDWMASQREAIQSRIGYLPENVPFIRK